MIGADPMAADHVDHHAQLKADYDARHPDAPLPILFGGLASHERIHELLAADYNVVASPEEMTLDHQELARRHESVHNRLHTAHNTRAEDGSAEEGLRMAPPKVDLDELFAEADQSARDERARGEIASAIQWESIRAAAGTLRSLQLRKAKKE